MGTDVLVAVFATDPGVPGAVDYPAGIGSRTIYASVNVGVARLRIQVYKRDQAGTETLLRDEYSDPFSDSVVTPQTWAASSSTPGTLAVTDRLVVRISAQRYSGGGSGTVVTTYWEGTTHTSRIQTTIAAGPQGPAGVGVPAGGATGRILSKKTAADYDTEWITPPSGGGGSTPTLVAALPGSPTEGQEVYFQNAAMEADGIVWHLRYRGKNADNSNNASAYKWEVLGEPAPLWAEDPNVTTTNQTGNVDPSNPVTKNLPLAGDYMIEHGWSGSNNAANGTNYQALTIGGANTVLDDAQMSEANANLLMGAHRKLRKLAQAAGAAVKIQHRVNTGTGTFYRRYLAITPIRVG